MWKINKVKYSLKLWECEFHPDLPSRKVYLVIVCEIYAPSVEDLGKIFGFGRVQVQIDYLNLAILHYKALLPWGCMDCTEGV